jgi:RNA polymerase sigma factor FliA
MIQEHNHFLAAKAYRGEVSDRVARFLPMVRKLAWHLAGSAGPSLDVEDLMQVGLVALTECAQRHGGPGEDGFAAYAKLRVRGAMVDLLRSSSPEVRGAREKRRRIEHTEQQLHVRLGRAPLAVEIAEALGLSLSEFEKMRSDCAAVHLDSIEECYSDSSSHFAAGDQCAETVLLQQEDSARLAEGIAHLPERLQLVIQLYFVEELNLAEIAEVLGVSVPRVHQLKAAALEKLKLSLLTE